MRLPACHSVSGWRISRRWRFLVTADWLTISAAGIPRTLSSLPTLLSAPAAKAPLFVILAPGGWRVGVPMFSGGCRRILGKIAGLRRDSVEEAKGEW